MPTLKVTQALRSAIYQAARAKLGRDERQNLLLEAGSRPTCEAMAQDRHEVTLNARLWAEDADLHDFCKLRDLREVEVDESGRCELDLYCYAGPMQGGRDYRELVTNVHVLFDASGILDAAETMERGPLALDPQRAALWGCTAEDTAMWRRAYQRSGLPIGG